MSQLYRWFQIDTHVVSIARFHDQKVAKLRLELSTGLFLFGPCWASPIVALAPVLVKLSQKTHTMNHHDIKANTIKYLYPSDFRFVIWYPQSLRFHTCHTKHVWTPMISARNRSCTCPSCICSLEPAKKGTSVNRSHGSIIGAWIEGSKLQVYGTRF